MNYHVQHYKYYLPKNPQCVRPSSIKKRSHPPQQTGQKHDFDEESGSGFRIPLSSSVKNVISLIKAITSLIGMGVILKIALVGSIDIAAALLVLHIGGIRALEIVLQVLKQKPL